MASLPDVPVLVSTWTNVHSTVGASIGAPLYVQNKTSTPILLYVSQHTPVDGSGMVVAGNDYNLLFVSPGTNEVLWCKSYSTTAGTIGVQE